ncbi:hypothetical protein BS50DRAFT_668632 [Corynespora cassiicola Philippines]|uniref:Ubiquitin 3 binding protein But2 C-terminal domain-containing protein n=1 Tax=Corynespora cassiicola Philippines TaxID=1448308 RepID=A0A2T2NLU3_CORCC|nr:hypothetical protein BS50DRAFT_668632 [Corynespora cassiicola Philippines]
MIIFTFFTLLPILCKASAVDTKRAQPENPGCPAPQVPIGTPSVSAPNSTPAKPSAQPPVPAGQFATVSPKQFKALSVKSSTTTIKNSCGYSLFVQSVGGEGCPPSQNIEIKPGSTYEEKLRECKSGGISLKVSKSMGAHPVVQVEYTHFTDPKNLWLSYDLSLIDCLKGGQGDFPGEDAADCVGHESGLQMGSGPGCPVFSCLGGEICNATTYWTKEFNYQPNAPVGGCSSPNGIAAEFCAGLNK